MRFFGGFYDTRPCAVLFIPVSYVAFMPLLWFFWLYPSSVLRFVASVSSVHPFYREFLTLDALSLFCRLYVSIV